MATRKKASAQGLANERGKDNATCFASRVLSSPVLNSNVNFGVEKK